MESIRVQIRLTAETLKKLDKMAEEYGLNRSAMVRLLIKTASEGAATTTRPYGDQ